MLVLPASSQALVAVLPLSRDSIPINFTKPLEHVLLRMIVTLTSGYRALLPDLSSPLRWAKFKAHAAERSDALKINDFYPVLYGDPQSFFRVAFGLSQIQVYRRWMTRLAIRTGYGDIVNQPVAVADQQRLRTFFEMVLRPIENLVQEVDKFEDWETIEKVSKHYWQEIHPTLSERRQRRVEADAQRYFSLFLYAMHNAISVMAYGESLASLVQRALDGGMDGDKAMCKVVRISDNMRHHPQFMARYLQAVKNSEKSFLRGYNLTSTPLTDKIRYPGFYFLLSLLDGFGLLDRLNNSQLGLLCDHARLDKWENRIEDEGYLGKRRNEYLRHKYIQMSMH